MAACATAQTIDFNTGQAARLIIGQKNFTISDYGATNQLIGSPAGLALANGTLWVVDSNRLGSTPNNNRILRFSDISTYPRTTDQPDIPGSTCGACRGTASLVLGQPDFFTTSRNLSASGVRNPTGVATDGNILVISDTDNNRVLIWNSLPRANGQPANVVIGQPDFVHNATAVPPTATSLRGPQGVWLQNGKLFIADSQDNRILIYNKIPTTNNAPADVVIGQKD
ncbi:MAG: repeat containing protein, partial [Bryobacterales bacterium]|nr:repeat containing protein [Bryobacterales bacterium]